MVVEVEVDYPEEGCQDHCREFIIIGTICYCLYLQFQPLKQSSGNTMLSFLWGLAQGTLGVPLTSPYTDTLLLITDNNQYTCQVSNDIHCIPICLVTIVLNVSLS